MSASRISLGSKIRSLRLGWFLAPRRECWVRISDSDLGFEIDLSPLADKIPDVKGSYRDLRGQNVDALLDEDARLRHLRRVKRRFSFYIPVDQPPQEHPTP